MDYFEPFVRLVVKTAGRRLHIEEADGSYLSFDHTDDGIVMSVNGRRASTYRPQDDNFAVERDPDMKCFHDCMDECGYGEECVPRCSKRCGC